MVPPHQHTNVLQSLEQNLDNLNWLTWGQMISLCIIIVLMIPNHKLVDGLMQWFRVEMKRRGENGSLRTSFYTSANPNWTQPLEKGTEPL